MPSMCETGLWGRHICHSRARSHYTEHVPCRKSLCSLGTQTAGKAFPLPLPRADFFKPCLSTWLLSDCLLRNSFLLGHAKLPACHAVCVSWTHTPTELWKLQSCFLDVSLKISCSLCASHCSKAGAETKHEWISRQRSAKPLHQSIQALILSQMIVKRYPWISGFAIWVCVSSFFSKKLTAFFCFLKSKVFILEIGFS